MSQESALLFCRSRDQSYSNIPYYTMDQCQENINTLLPKLYPIINIKLNKAVVI